MPQLTPATRVLEKAVADGHIPGAVLHVHHHGEVVHRDAHGVLDPETRYPLRPDTVLWLASLSKPIGAAALLMLADDGRLDVHDPVSAYLPEFAEPGRVRVLRPGSPSPMTAPFGPPPDPLPEFDIVPAERELTVADLLTHTGGLQSIGVWNPEYRPPGPGETLAGHVPGLAHVVRDFPAGRGWAYSNAASFDVLSRIIEVVSGRDLNTFLHARIFEPLGMTATGFGKGGQAGAMPLPPGFADNPVVRGDSFRTTSAGLWASPDDYLTFAEALGRLLSEQSVERMTTNAVGDLCPGLNGREPAPGIGFGYAVAVVEDPHAAGEALPPGTFGWDGVVTRRFWVSPTGGWSMFYYVPDPAVQRELEAAVVEALG